MREPLKLMCVFAHPDDETLGCGGVLAKYAAEGIQTYLVTATLGERGWTGAPEDNPGLDALARIRREELNNAARVLGIQEVSLLGYIDGDLDKADPAEATAKIAAHIRRVRPQVVISFGLDGIYGHPDHIIISQLTTAALVCAADPTFATPGREAAFRVSKFYTMIVDQGLIEAYLPLIGEISMEVDGEVRRPVVWPDWQITTRVDTAEYWQTATQAVACHRSQLPEMDTILSQPEAVHRRVWGCQTFARMYSLVNGGRALETDLFEGLRGEPIQPPARQPQFSASPQGE